MESGIKVAISGKGGVGKTTVCAVLSQLFAEDGLDVLAIDADSDTNLASAFGISSDQCPEPLIKMKELIAERTGTGKEATGAYFKLNPKVSDLPAKYQVEADNVKLLTLGAITGAGAGCACSQAAFLKAMLSHIVLQREEVVFIDLAAGVEFMGRASVQGIDCIVVVVEPGARSIETAINIARMAKELGIKLIAAIMNKIADPEQIEAISSSLCEAGINIVGDISYSPSVQQSDLEHSRVFQASPEFIGQLRQAKDKLQDLIRNCISL